MRAGRSRAGWMRQNFGHGACLRIEPRFPSLLLQGHIAISSRHGGWGDKGGRALLDTHASAALLHSLHRIFHLTSGSGKGGHRLAPFLSLSHRRTDISATPCPRPLYALVTQSMHIPQNTFQTGGFPVDPSRGWSTLSPLQFPPPSTPPRLYESNFHPQGWVPATQNLCVLSWTSFFSPSGARGSSTWCRRPCGDQVVTSVSYWFLNILQR
jgi:hypothetical protein